MMMLLSSGCGGSKDQVPGSTTDATQVEAEHDHSGWWCAEHGIPEEECSLCSAQAAAKFREEGDWCEEHNRAQSQCFLCDPSRADKFAKLYEAKFGEKPPQPAQ
jgi:hypothetical protein